jgi:hypothetical protein
MPCLPTFYETSALINKQNWFDFNFPESEVSNRAREWSEIFGEGLKKRKT